jgi:hypothetical protein
MQAPKEHVEAWVAALTLPISGTVEFIDAQKRLEKPVRFTIDPKKKVRWDNWHNADQSVTLKGPKEPFELSAHIRYTAGDLSFDYTRPILVNKGEEWGGGEKQRPVTNDRRVWALGTLLEDHTRWELSFQTPSGYFIAAATQGNEVLVHEGDRRWVTPRDQTLLAGSECEFCFTSGWQGFEARIPEVRLKKVVTPEIRPDGFRFQPVAKEGDVTALSDGDPGTACVLAWPASEGDVAPRITIDMKLPREQQVRALDARVGRSRLKLVVKAWVDDDWRDVYWGRSGTIIHALVPTRTGKLRLVYTRTNKREKEFRLGELRVFGSANR